MEEGGKQREGVRGGGTGKQGGRRRRGRVLYDEEEVEE